MRRNPRLSALAIPRPDDSIARRRRLLATLGAALLAALLAAAAGRALASTAVAEDPEHAVQVKVERVAPAREKLPSLRFLRDNLDFLRGRQDLLREKPVKGHGEPEAVNPRFLDYRRLLLEARTSGDSTQLAADSTGRIQLLASITQLGTLESQLDLLERQLAAQRTRLGVLQADFTGRQRTALIVVLSGVSGAATPNAVELTLDDGPTVSVPLSAEERQSLAKGGVVQLFHGFVEPREQVVAVRLAGDAWPAGRGYLTLEPERDALTLLRLDLAAPSPAAGVTALAASSWRIDPETSTGER